MGKRTQLATSWIALGAMLIWSCGFCCCMTGTSCCSSVAHAEQPADGADHHGGACCSHKEADPKAPAPEDSGGTIFCDCDSHTKAAIDAVPQLLAVVPEEAPKLPEPSPTFWTVSAPEKLFLPYTAPIPHQRGPPAATGLS